MTNDSGVYLITCIKTGKRYVGCSRNIKNRWSHHKYNLRTNQHANQHLQRSYNKHGPKAFVYTVLELTEAANVFELENHYIESLKPEYNMHKNPYVSPEKPTKGEPEDCYDEAYVEDEGIDWRMFENKIWLTEDEIIDAIDNSRSPEPSVTNPYMLWFLALPEDEQIVLHIDTMRRLDLLPLDKIKSACKDVGYSHDSYKAKLETIKKKFPVELLRG